VAAARRARRIRSADEGRAYGELETVWATVAIHELDPELESDAVALARTHPISGADAVHVAAAIAAGAVLLTWDQRQAAAAIAEGLAVLPQG